MYFLLYLSVSYKYDNNDFTIIVLFDLKLSLLQNGTTVARKEFKIKRERFLGRQ